MSQIKKQIMPITFVLMILIINASLWVYYMNKVYLSQEVILTAIMGSSLLMGFMIVFLLSTRNFLMTRIFGGLENLYVWHRILAMTTTALIFVHGFFATSKGLINIPDIFLIGRSNEAGELARNLFIGLIIFALLAKYMKYEHFRYIHRLLIIPYLIALYHGFYTSVLNLFTFNLLSVWMFLTSFIALSASLYMILIYQRTAFNHKGTIVSQTMVNDQVIEIKVKMDQPYHFIPGQFAFMKIYGQKIPKEPHPFSISGYDGVHIYFTIKMLGDYTSQLYKNLNTPADIRLSKAYGDMTFKSNKKQLWIVGGIGITPFLGYLRSQVDIDKNIHLIHSVKTLEESIHLDQLNILSKENPSFTFTLHDVFKKGFIKVDDLSIKNDNIIYMCGPRHMVMSIKKNIKAKHPHIPVIYEAFSFTGTLIEDIINAFKKITKAIQKNSD